MQSLQSFKEKIKERVIKIENSDTKYCSRCGKVLKNTEFYKTKRLDKYPDGFLDLCKKCTTAHIDNWNPDTYLPILEEVDVLYLPDKWNEILNKCTGSNKKITGMTVIGKYLSLMKIRQYSDYGQADSERYIAIEANKIKDTLKASGMSQIEIDEQLAAGAVTPPPKPVEAVPTFEHDEDFDVDLTDEDKTYLKLKWGKNYTPFELVQMEQLYKDFEDSYDIQTAGHIDTLKAICKTSLRMNQLFDIGDIDGALKMTKAYDQLMKSGRFTAAQNKGESGDYVDSVGEIAMMCEKEGFIPRYYIDQPNDKVDWMIKDNQEYVKRLVTEEMNLGDMLEKALKLIEEDKNREEDSEADEDDSFEEELFADAGPVTLTDEDFIKFREFEEELAKEDKKKMTDTYEKNDKKIIRKIKKEGED